MANGAAAVEILNEVFAPATARRVAGAAADVLRPVGRGAEHARGGGGSADRRQRLHPGVRRPPTACRSSWSRRRCSSTSEPPAPGRAPEFNEHGDEILDELGLDWDTIVDLKVRGVVA